MGKGGEKNGTEYGSINPVMDNEKQVSHAKDQPKQGAPESVSVHYAKGGLNIRMAMDKELLEKLEKEKSQNALQKEIDAILKENKGSAIPATKLVELKDSFSNENKALNELNIKIKDTNEKLANNFLDQKLDDIDNLIKDRQKDLSRDKNGTDFDNNLSDQIERLELYKKDIEKLKNTASTIDNAEKKLEAINKNHQKAVINVKDANTPASLSEGYSSMPTELLATNGKKPTIEEPKSVFAGQLQQGKKKLKPVPENSLNGRNNNQHLNTTQKEIDIKNANASAAGDLAADNLPPSPPSTADDINKQYDEILFPLPENFKLSEEPDFIGLDGIDEAAKAEWVSATDTISTTFKVQQNHQQAQYEKNNSLLENLAKSEDLTLKEREGIQADLKRLQELEAASKQEAEKNAKEIAEIRERMALILEKNQVIVDKIKESPEMSEKLSDIDAKTKKANKPFEKEIEWKKKEDGVRLSEITNADGQKVVDLKESTINTKPIEINGHTINSYRQVDFPKELPADGAGGPLSLSMAVKGVDGKNISADDPAYFTANYNEAGKLMGIDSPEPVKFTGEGQDAMGYIEKNGEIYTLPVIKGQYNEMKREIAKNRENALEAKDLVVDKAEEKEEAPDIFSDKPKSKRNSNSVGNKENDEGLEVPESGSDRRESQEPKNKQQPERGQQEEKGRNDIKDTSNIVSKTYSKLRAKGWLPSKRALAAIAVATVVVIASGGSALPVIAAAAAATVAGSKLKSTYAPSQSQRKREATRIIKKNPELQGTEHEKRLEQSKNYNNKQEKKYTRKDLKALKAAKKIRRNVSQGNSNKTSASPVVFQGNQGKKGNQRG